MSPHIIYDLVFCLRVPPIPQLAKLDMTVHKIAWRPCGNI